MQAEAENQERVLVITRVFDAPRAGVQMLDRVPASGSMVGAQRLHDAGLRGIGKGWRPV